MIAVCSEIRPLDQDELEFRRKALKSAVICIGWLKLISVMCYMILYFLVLYNSKGSRMSTAIQYMLLAIIPLIVTNGMLLFVGGLQEKAWALQAGIWLSLVIAAYETALGVLGGMYFIRTGYLTMHFMLAAVFAVMVISVFTVVCHDVIIINTYRKILRSSVT